MKSAGAEEDRKGSAAHVKKKAAETVQATTEYVSDTKEEFQKKMEKNVSDIETDIAVLKSKAEKTSQDTRDKVNREIGALELRRDQMKQKLQDLRTSSSQAWKELGAGISNAWSELKNAVSRAKSEFN